MLLMFLMFFVVGAARACVGGAVGGCIVGVGVSFYVVVGLAVLLLLLSLL